MSTNDTPLASTAMEAATPRTDAIGHAIGSFAARWKDGQIHAMDFIKWTDEELNKCRAIERELAAFQPLLAKVEGEKQALVERVVLFEDKFAKEVTASTALRADLAAAKTERDGLHRLIAARKDDQEMAEIGTELIQLVEANTLERDESFETADVLASHYKELTQLRADLAAKEEALKHTAKQPLTTEMDFETRVNGDFYYAYDALVKEARSALASRADKGGAT